MRAFRVGLPLLLLLVFASFVAYHSPRSIRGQTSPATQSSGGTVPTHTLFSGLWRVDSGFVSTIRIKNSLVVGPLEVTPVLYMADGTAYELPPVNLAKTAVASVSVNEALANAPPELAAHLSQFGSAALRYRYRAPGVLRGSTELMSTANSLVFDYPFEDVGESPSARRTLEGLWWRQDPRVAGFVAFTNTGQQPAEVTFQVIGSEGSELTAQSLTLAGHTTRMMDLDALSAGLPGLESHAGGLRVQYNGITGAVLVSGGLENDRQGYSAKMPFWPRSAGPSDPVYASAGIVLGNADPAAGFPAGTRFSPYAAVRNTTSSALSLTPGLWYMSGSQPVSVTLPTVTLNPYQTKQIGLPRMIPSAGLADYNGTANLVFSLTGHAGDVVIATGSVDATNNYVFEVAPEIVGQSLSKTNNFWRFGDGFDTMFALWNPGSKVQDIDFILYYGDGSGKYKLPLHLGPKASERIDIGALITDRRPDAEGNVIPGYIKDGSAVFQQAKGVTEPIELIVSVGALNVGTATCSGYCIFCDGYNYIWVDPNPVDVLVGTTALAKAKGLYNNGSEQPVPGASWATTDPTVATVDYSGTVTGVAYGSCTITVSANLVYYGQHCGTYSPNCYDTRTFSASATARSRETKWAVLRTETLTVYALCGSTERDRYYQGHDDYGWIPFQENWKLNETVTFLSSSDCRPILDGTDFNVGFTDGIAVCPKTCTVETDQTISVAMDQFHPLRGVGVKDCETCRLHSGYHTKSTGTSVTVTDNP